SVVDSHGVGTVWRRAAMHFGARRNDVPWPLPNVWLGTAVEDQRWAGIRIPKLIDTTSSIKFLSCEPLIGPVDLMDVPTPVASDPLPGYHWVIAGGESGPGARPVDPGWVRHLRDQCQDLDVAFFFKQWGGRTPKAGGRE